MKPHSVQTSRGRSSPAGTCVTKLAGRGGWAVELEAVRSAMAGRSVARSTHRNKRANRGHAGPVFRSDVQKSSTSAPRWRPEVSARLRRQGDCGTRLAKQGRRFMDKNGQGDARVQQAGRDIGRRRLLRTMGAGLIAAPAILKGLRADASVG